MATSSTMAAHSTSSSSTFISPDPQTLNNAKDPSPPSDSSNSDDTIIVIGENTSIEEDEEMAEPEEEDEECGFCLFMKGGGCKDSFVAWEKCVEEAEKSGENVVKKCMEVTSLLKKCMDDHGDYYEPILRAEREMENAISDAEAEKEIVKGADA